MPGVSAAAAMLRPKSPSTKNKKKKDHDLLLPQYSAPELGDKKPLSPPRSPLFKKENVSLQPPKSPGPKAKSPLMRRAERAKVRLLLLFRANVPKI